MMTTATQAPVVVDAAVTDRPQTTAALVAAFTADPFIRWMLPDANQYLTYFPEVLRHFGGGAFDCGSAHRTSDFSGAALWLPPGVLPDEEALGGVMQAGVAPDLHDEVFGVLEQVGASHPDEEHWYLPTIGVDPRSQGIGHGSALLTHALATIDEQRVAAYLESTNPRNVPLYERFGFSVVGEIRAGSSPTVTPMFRPRTEVTGPGAG
jgi:ribosomal protein S18 acetylase RimI-like enzyme